MTVVTDVEQQDLASPNVPCVTLVVPVFNEQDAIGPFLDQIEQLLKTMHDVAHFDIVFVNDGSRDGTELAIRSCMSPDRAISLVNLSRNFGKEAALWAGLKYATGDAVIPIDVDLQDDPTIIPEMIAKWRAGAQIVNARRSDRSSDTWIKRVTAQGFYRVFNAVADQPIPQDVGDFRLLDRQVVDVLCTLSERVRLNKALFGWVGFPTEEVLFERHQRSAGVSTFSYWRLWNMALDGIFASTTKPLRIWTYIGSSLALLSFVYAGYLFLRTLVFGVDVPGYASTVVLILLFGGLNLFAVGILGEYIGRILTEVRDRPLYVVRNAYLHQEPDT
ncbi:MAG: glycosyltransferase family 2 protein [Rhodobacteraceae bacterium]|nr:glycosyltransferase family 2 protein [Paracoccaceae bacterium]